MLMGDQNGILPSNTGSGYILRRLLRRAIRHSKSLNLTAEDLLNVASIYIDQVYNEAYPLLVEKKDYILSELLKEINKFEATLSQGIKEFEKVVSSIERKREFMQKQDPNAVVENIINGKSAFRLYDTFGFPIEITKEMAAERGFTVDEEGYKEAFKQHQELARTASAGTFKGGLASHGKMETLYHTATHLTLAGLRKMFGTNTVQKGSNITAERMRFDFNLDHKMTDEEIKTLENFVNDAIKRAIPVECKEMTFGEAKKSGAYGIFNASDDDMVKVYVIGDVDNQICGGPHASNTKGLGSYKITKEESSSSGVRRIKAVIYPAE